jgi:cyclopropane fatty-acyl-phospholipid synthase-like methyltransferase
MDWNARFSSPDYVFGKVASQFVVRMEPKLARGSKVLCIADGEGRNSVYLAQSGHQVDANDFASNAIEKAKLLAAEAGVTVSFAQADLSAWDWPKHKYDAVFAVFFQFAEPAFRDRIFAGLKQVVVPGGRIFLHGYTPKQLEYKTGGPPDAERLYTEDLLRASFADCDIETLVAYEAELDEGPGHSGRSALIDLIARTRKSAP